MFAGVPAEIYPQTNQREAFYHAILHLLFDYLGLRLKSGESVALGRSDTVIETLTHVYILEYKLDAPASVALQQIREKGYAAKYQHRGKAITGVGVCFSSATKNIAAWEAEEIG
jgi:hypothetical protein